MNVLLISNQFRDKTGIGNPVIENLISQMTKNEKLHNIYVVKFHFSINSFLKALKFSRKSDIIHIHFGGLYALLMILVTKTQCNNQIITFHGTDIHAGDFKKTKNILLKVKIKINQFSSFISIPLIKYAGFVAESMIESIPQYLKNRYKNKFFIQNLGVDYNQFVILDRTEAKLHLNLDNNISYVLFSDISNSYNKRRDIAEAICKKLGNKFQLLILSRIKPQEVKYYIAASEFLLLTSNNEGSPNIVRECLASNCPVFSVEVGDVKEQIHGLKKSAIISRDPQEAAELILKTYNADLREDSRKIKERDINLQHSIEKIITLYEHIIE